ncbi:hypothetical protein AK812_SmicGene23111 [Symbiodinium microadriaticum]|uniref:Uncharacterized protein n=1 Tax=Symbiodinium microadriaticum TaxID=2951 RepID=A0A1Q9DI93_SYMMI|nr:hypothetical protein AK812_SmicGene23111 [Symbiodinium microadriaticum]
MKELFHKGLVNPVTGKTHFFCILNIIGDWPFLAKSFQWTRTFGNSAKKATSKQAAKGICHACWADKPGYPWEDFESAEPRWRRTLNRDEAYDAKPVLMELPHDPADPSAFAGQDYFHGFHLGAGKVFVSSALALLSSMFPGGSFAARFKVGGSERQLRYASLYEEESHNRPILPNEFGEELSAEVPEVFATSALCSFLLEEASEKGNLIRIELDKIGFGAFFTLELHEKSDGWFLQYFLEPQAVSFQDLQSLVLPLGREKTLRKVQAFVKLLGRADLGPTRHGWHTFDAPRLQWVLEWKELYRDAFESFDQNKAARVLAVSHGGYERITDLIFHLVDREPETDALSQEAGSECSKRRRNLALHNVRLSLSLDMGDMDNNHNEEEAHADGDDDDDGAPGDVGITKLMSASNAGHALPDEGSAAGDGDHDHDDCDKDDDDDDDHDDVDAGDFADVGDVNVLRALLEKGADVNAQDDYGPDLIKCTPEGVIA